MEIHKVSRETAKKVLKMLSVEGLIIQKPGKGSFVADTGPCEKKWAAVLPFYSRQYEYVLSQIAEKAASAGREFLHFIDYNSHDEEMRIVGQLVNQRYEVVIVIPTAYEPATSEFYARLKTGKTFIMLMDHTITGSYFPYVIQSYDLGVERAMSYLFSKCNDNAIVFVENEIWADRNAVQSMMHETFLKTGETTGNNVRLLSAKPGAVSAEFVRKNDIRGIFCADDIDAIRIAGRLREQGLKFPDDVSLVSYGNTELARYFTPAITAIDPGSDEMVSIMMKILERKMSGLDVGLSQYVVQPELIVRET
jgi:DNA-binding LacI/PurR family transcriptional regulator